MRWLAFLLISSSWAIAGSIEDLASPVQQVRDKAAAELRKTFVVPPRKAWDELVASIKAGDTEASVMDRLKALNVTPDPIRVSGQRLNASYRLDGVWILWVACIRLADKTGEEATVITNVSVEERLQDLLVEPPKGFSGTWTTYYANGQRSQEIHYAGGRYSGEFTAFGTDGLKRSVRHYGPHGLEGEEIGYYPSGGVTHRGFHKDGKPTGTWTFYNEDGSVQETEEHPE